MTTTSIAPAARPIPGHNRLTGELVALVPSSSQPGAYHVTTALACDCKGWKYRGSCRHLTAARASRGLQNGGTAHLAVQRAAGAWPALSAETKAKAAEYTSIFGTDGEG